MLRFVLLAALAALTVFPARAMTEVERVAAIMEAADQKDWLNVRQLGLAGGVAGDLAQWRILSAGEGRWDEYRDFARRNPDWPNLARIRREGERTMPTGLTLNGVDGFVGESGPATGLGALRRTEALVAAGRRAEAARWIADAWPRLTLTVDERILIRAAWGKAVAPMHRARADALVWRGATGEAMEMAPLIGGAYAKLIEARVKLRRRARGVDAAIRAVPASLQDDPGLAYERFLWRMRKGRLDGAEEIIRARSVSEAALGRPEAWANRRRALARRAMRAGRVRTAYALASRHFLTSGGDYADLEWLSGYIALRKLGDARLALSHFQRFRAVAGTPISLGRAEYWLGRAHEALGDGAAARAAYVEAARHQTSFYGQIAAMKIGAAPLPYLTAATDGGRPVARGSVAEAARLLSLAGDRRRAHWFLTHLGDLSDAYGDFAGAAALSVSLGRPDAAIRIAKRATRKGHLLRGHYYPVTPLARFDQGVEPALAMAIARQESELNPEAISHAGARGLMQLMPATARKVAGWIGERYSRSRLTADWRYNATLGQTYLARRLGQFDGSVALAAAAYNAGANRAERWARDYGDPRDPSVDYIDWIESIPFRETRNYVQRVLEGLQVYRSRIAGRPVPFRIEADARGR